MKKIVSAQPIEVHNEACSTGGEGNHERNSITANDARRMEPDVVAKNLMAMKYPSFDGDTIRLLKDLDPKPDVLESLKKAANDPKLPPVSPAIQVSLSSWLLPR